MMKIIVHFCRNVSVPNMASIAPANNHVTLDPSTSPVQSITARHPTVGDIQETEVREITTLTPQQTDDEHHEQSDNSHKPLSASTYWVPVYVSLAVMFACVGCVVTMCIYYRNTTKEPENQ
eukprot:673979_1